MLKGRGSRVAPGSPLLAEAWPGAPVKRTKAMSVVAATTGFTDRLSVHTKPIPSSSSRPSVCSQVSPSYHRSLVSSTATRKPAKRKGRQASSSHAAGLGLNQDGKRTMTAPRRPASASGRTAWLKRSQHSTTTEAGRRLRYSLEPSRRDGRTWSCRSAHSDSGHVGAPLSSDQARTSRVNPGGVVLAQRLATSGVGGKR